MACKRQVVHLFSFCPTRLEQSIPFPCTWAFVVASSGVIADKTGTKLHDYNRAALLGRKACEVAAAALALPQPTTLAACVRAAGDDPLGRIRGFLAEAAAGDLGTGGGAYEAEDLVRRFEQFYHESERIIPGVAEALLAAGDGARLGELVAESQRRSDEGLKNIVEETRWLPAEAAKLGSLAASAFGAGFGGSVWAIVDHSDAIRFRDAWRDAYTREFPQWRTTCEFFIMTPGDSVAEL
mmetsp:Transcript_42649/g.90336  ORF Transcript_42649/g.90336 Transcript_42649/m.90336 type:complete len:239 (+) Transcript_42649:1-717(+)